MYIGERLFFVSYFLSSIKHFIIIREKKLKQKPPLNVSRLNDNADKKIANVIFVSIKFQTFIVGVC